MLGSLGSGLARVPATGGSITEIIVPDIEAGERGHSLPEVLPNGKAVLYTIVTGLSFERTRIGVLSLETGERHVLVENGLVISKNVVEAPNAVALTASVILISPLSIVTGEDPEVSTRNQGK